MIIKYAHFALILLSTEHLKKVHSQTLRRKKKRKLNFVCNVSRIYFMQIIFKIY